MKKRMMIMNGIILGVILTFLFSSNLHAQYALAAGIRLGGTSGVAGKYFYKPDMAVEGIVGTFGNGFSVTGLLEKSIAFYNAKGLYLYYGGGVHTAFYNGKGSAYSNFGREVDYQKDNDVGFGVNGIVGLEYRLPENIPIAFSVDLKPFVEIGTSGHVAVAPDPSIGIKFIIK